MIILAAALQGSMSPICRGSLEQPGMATLARRGNHSERHVEIIQVTTPLELHSQTHADTLDH